MPPPPIFFVLDQMVVSVVLAVRKHVIASLQIAGMYGPYVVHSIQPIGRYMYWSLGMNGIKNKSISQPNDPFFFPDDSGGPPNDIATSLASTALILFQL